MNPGGPGGTSVTRVALHSEQFAADPHRVYREMRHEHGDLAPVELAPDVPATLVIGYGVALRILHDPQRFPADPRPWQKNLPPQCPITSNVEWRPNALRNTGEVHTRYRGATSAALDAVDLHALHRTVEARAVPLINSFCGTGAADLMSQYVFPLLFDALNAIIGCPDDIGAELAEAFTAMFDGGDADSINTQIVQALSRLIEHKRHEPDDDIATRLLTHPAALDDEELINQLVTMYAAGIEPGRNLIGNALRLILTDDRFAGEVLGGSLPVAAALDEVLFNDPPLANYCLSYPRQPVLMDGVWLPANQPVVISMAGCNTDPAIRSTAAPSAGNRSHLAFSAGPHTCPAERVATLIARDAVEQVLDALPEMRLACPPDALEWRRGPFHRALAALPVVFDPMPPLIL